MPRGPFQGTWQPGIRPTVVHSPDALVYINGEVDVLGCPKCRRKLDWNKYITSIQVDLNIDSAPGTASINVSVPRHSVDEFYFDGNPLITPMMEVEIFAKGYYLVEGLPQYYPIFWGIVTEVSDSYSGGEHSFSINCADILKWWELCKMNINPAFTQGSGQMGRSIFGNVLFGTNPYDLIWTLAQQAFGDVVVGTGSLVSLYKEGQQKQTFNAALGDIMLYWQQRFSKIRSNLLLYGTQGNAVRGDVLYQTYQRQGGAKKFSNSKAVPYASQAVRQANGGNEGSQMVFDPTDPGVTAFRTQFSQAGQVNFWQSEYQTKLEIANACKEAIGFEFYMDVTGDIVFKPPFYNLDILSNKPLSWIQDIDIIDWDFSESEAEVVTQLQIQGSFGGNVDYGFGEEATPGTSVTDYHLLRKYGWRTHQFNSEFMGSPLLMFYTGLDMIDRLNARRWRGTVNVPLRPELRLGFPIYIAPKDQIWYIQGISHNIQFGGRAQTTLSLTAKRGKFLAPKGIGSIELTKYGGAPNPTPGKPLKDQNISSKQLRDKGFFKATIGGAAQIPPDPKTASAAAAGEDNPYDTLVLRHPKTGRVVGYPNVVMAYTRPFQPPPDQLSAMAGKKQPGEKRIPPGIKQIETEAPKIIQQFDASHTATNDDRLKEKLKNNRYSYGLNSAGVYTYLHDISKVIKDVLLLPKKNIDFGTEANQASFEGSTGMLRPVSDERGFEVIGHFRYGRGVSLRDGSLVLNETAENPGAENSQAAVRNQFAIGGGLFETLTAQSSGLTTGPLSDANPAYVLATLGDEDLQTAATINPKTKKPEFDTTGTNFVQTAPLQSPEQVGAINKESVPSVEASQLSRALTLAEMSVRDAVTAVEECDCILGRPDLAFINVGYQLRVLTASKNDTTTIGFGAGLANDVESSSENAAAREALATQRKAAGDAAAAEARRFHSNDPLKQDVPGGEQAIEKEAVLAQEAALKKFDEDHRDEINTIGNEEALGLLTEAIRDGRPVGAEAALSREAMMSRVDQFLVTLYTALDVSHQEYEKALRGDLLKIQNERTPDEVRFAPPGDLGGVAPPYGPGGRGLGGDPEALALLADSAVDDIGNSWEQFGDDLANETKKAELKAEIQELKIRAAGLQTAIDAKATVGETDPELEAELQEVLEQLAYKQHELDVLNQSG